MFTKRVSVLIARPIEDIFEFLEDARNRPRWDDSVDSEVTEHERPTGMTIESTSGPFPTTLASR